MIGLLGGIASGKSRVAALLAEAGAVVLDADVEARAALAEPDVVAQLRERHGDAILGVDGAIDRARLARATFGHPEHLAHLEQLLHPRVRERLERRLDDELARRAAPAIVLDVPLLLETAPFAQRCDLLLFIESPAPERRRRTVARRGWDEDELARRERHQLAPEEKRRRADVVLRNDGTEGELRDRLFAWLAAAGGFASLPRRTDPTSRASAHGREGD